MCGIFGALNYDHNNLSDLHRASQLQYYRGPDQWNHYATDQCYLASNRLIIRDLPNATQPFTTQQGDVLVFNGEIYNLAHLKKRFQLPSTLKSEVEILCAIFELSTNMANTLSKINGIFALAYYKSAEQKLYVARDHFGVKPLFYTQQKEAFYFSSEITPLNKIRDDKPVYNSQSIHYFLEANYINSPETIYQHIHSLAPGSLLIVTKQSSNIINYWETKDLIYSPIVKSCSEQEILFQAMDRQFERDQQQGLFLSSGIDSNLIALRAKYNDINLKCYTVVYKGDDSESEITKQNCKKLDFPHHCAIFGPEQFVQTLESASRHISQPLGDPGFYPLYFLTTQIDPEIKVCFSGDGADEIHFGYPTYWASLFTSLQQAPWKSLSSLTLSGFKKEQFARSLKVPCQQRHSAWRKVNDLFSLLVNPPLGQSPYLNDYRYVTERGLLSNCILADFHHWLPGNNLFKVDMATMPHSIETRVPYLDLEMATFFLTLNLKRKLPTLKKKTILHQAFNSSNHYNLKVLPKKSFTPPYKDWFSKDLYDYLGDHFQAFDWKKWGISQEKVLEMLKKHQRKELDLSYNMLNLISLVQFDNLKGK